MSRLIVAFPKTLDNVSSDLQAYLYREELIHICEDPEFNAHPSSPPPISLEYGISAGFRMALPGILHCITAAHLHSLALSASFDSAGVVQVKLYKFRVSTNSMMHGNTQNPRTS
jgi:hypothetical protein